jgi:selenophosphate synthase
MRIDRVLDELGLEFCFDAQTSGGLLVSLPPGSGQEFHDQITQAGEPAPVRIGEVTEKSEVAIVLH